MTKISIAGDYLQAGEYLTRYEDGQTFHIQPNISKPKPKEKRRPPYLLILIQKGQRVRISGLFPTATPTDLPVFSCDYGGRNYLLTMGEQVATIIPKGAKNTGRPVMALIELAMNGKKLAAPAPPAPGQGVKTTTDITPPNQLALW